MQKDESDEPRLYATPSSVRAGSIELAGCYDEMRRMARRLLGSADNRLIIQPTELAHEAAIRLLSIDPGRFVNEAHLLATAARITRQALIDEIRSAQTLKRRAPMLITAWPDRDQPVALDLLDRALKALAEVSPDHARIVELRFSLGLTVEEAAASEGLSPRTVKRRWAAARAWLQQRLEAEGHD